MSVTKIKQAWISVNLIMIIMMIIIGGITRLTDSGLSMTEWNLIGGIIPPLNQGDWLEIFSKYKDTPEFIQKNFDISLGLIEPYNSPFSLLSLKKTKDLLFII